MSHRALLHAARVVKELAAGAGQVGSFAGRLLQDGGGREVALVHIGGNAGCDSGVEEPVSVDVLQAGQGGVGTVVLQKGICSSAACLPSRLARETVGQSETCQRDQTSTRCSLVQSHAQNTAGRQH